MEQVASSSPSSVGYISYPMRTYDYLRPSGLSGLIQKLFEKKHGIAWFDWFGVEIGNNIYRDVSRGLNLGKHLTLTYHLRNPNK